MKKTIYILIAIAAVFLIGAALVMLFMGPQTVMARLMGAPAPPEGLDTSTTRLSDQGLFQVTYASSLAPIPINQIHTWTIHVETAEGQPVEQASITVDGGMPQHGHGLPTQPEVTQDLGNGDYTVEGMKFNMPGWWTVTFSITAGGQTDRVTYNLVLE
jgi:hypothetical protein